MPDLPLDERNTDRIRSACRAWFGADLPVLEPLPAGFSGAQPVVVRAGPDAWVVKSFPATANRARAAWIHGLMRHLRQSGVEEVPPLMATPDGDTFREAAAGIWEVVGFVSGVSTEAPTPAQAREAARVLARIHQAARTWPGEPPRRGTSPGLLERRRRAALLGDDPWPACGGCPAPAGGFRAAVAMRRVAAGETFAAFGGTRIMRLWSSVALPEADLQPVLRDVWSDHVLFAPGQPERVAGVVDFHAAGIDTPALDVARLFGSWRSSADRRYLPLDARWREAMAAYVDEGPLTNRELGLVPVLHALGVVFGLDNWFRWAIDEHREFSDSQRALERIDVLLGELPAALALLGEHRVETGLTL